MTQLPERLRAIARHIPPGAAVADIGAGDARLAVYLAAEPFYCRVIATEASAAGLAQAARRVEASGTAVTLRRGWGLEPLQPGEVAVIVIAGMGGITISHILQRRPERLRPRCFILQPMGRAAHLRAWLHRQEWTVLDEDLACEGRRFYEIIVTVPPPVSAEASKTGGAGGDCTREPLLAGGEVGAALVARGHPLLGEFLAAKAGHYRRLVAATARSRLPQAGDRAAAVLAELEELAGSVTRE